MADRRRDSETQSPNYGYENHYWNWCSYPPYSYYPQYSDTGLRPSAFPNDGSASRSTLPPGESNIDNAVGLPSDTEDDSESDTSTANKVFLMGGSVDDEHYLETFLFEPHTHTHNLSLSLSLSLSLVSFSPPLACWIIIFVRDIIGVFLSSEDD